jgi:hypothetical protein
MKRRSVFFALLCTLILATLYLASYYILAEKDSGRARGAGMYFHYRFFNSDFLATLFLPAAWMEFQAIQLYPQPFLPNPSWAAEPQALILQSPNRNLCFSKSKLAD